MLAQKNKEPVVELGAFRFQSASHLSALSIYLEELVLETLSYPR